MAFRPWKFMHSSLSHRLEGMSGSEPEPLRFVGTSLPSPCQDSFLPNAVNCVKGEIHNVLYVMRLNRRWASEARFKVEIPLQASGGLFVQGCLFPL
jgi:hypothetical protein